LEEELLLHFQGGLSSRHKSLIRKMGLQDQIMDYGYLPHKQAVANLKRADALWLISDYGKEYKQVTSGKLFEYIGSCKPIFGLIHHGSEEERLLANYRASYAVEPDKHEEGAGTLLKLYRDWKSESLPSPDYQWVGEYDRKKITEKLSGYFDRIVSPQSEGQA
jgi:hypothetical protein